MIRYLLTYWAVSLLFDISLVLGDPLKPLLRVKTVTLIAKIVLIQSVRTTLQMANNPLQLTAQMSVDQSDGICNSMLTLSCFH